MRKILQSLIKIIPFSLSFLIFILLFSHTSNPAFAETICDSHDYDYRKASNHLHEFWNDSANTSDYKNYTYIIYQFKIQFDSSLKTYIDDHRNTFKCAGIDTPCYNGGTNNSLYGGTKVTYNENAGTILWEYDTQDKKKEPEVVYNGSFFTSFDFNVLPNTTPDNQNVNTTAKVYARLVAINKKTGDWEIIEDKKWLDLGCKDRSIFHRPSGSFDKSAKSPFKSQSKLKGSNDIDTITTVHKDNTIEYSLYFKNESSMSPLEQVILKDTIPNNLNFLQFTGSTSCNNRAISRYCGSSKTTGDTCPDGTKNIKWEISPKTVDPYEHDTTDIAKEGALGPGQYCAITYKAKVKEENGQTFQNNAVLDLNYDETKQNDISDWVKHQTEVSAPPVPLMTKTSDPAPDTAVDYNQNIVYTIQVGNSSTVADIKQATIYDTFDSNTDFGAFGNTDYCLGRKITPSRSGNNINWLITTSSGIAIPKNTSLGTSCYVTYTVKVKDNLPYPTEIINNAYLKTELGDTNHVKLKHFINKPDLWIKKSSVPAPKPDPAYKINAGETITYTITYGNNGPSKATNVKITDTFTDPSYFSSLTFSPNPDNVNVHPYVWTIGTLTKGQNGKIIITATTKKDLSYPKEIINNAYITSKEVPRIDVLPLIHEIKPPILEIKKRASIPYPSCIDESCYCELTETSDKCQIKSGDTITYYLYYRNTGGSKATNVKIEDTFSNTYFTTITGVPPYKTPVQNYVYTWELGTLMPDSVWYKVKVTATTKTSLTGGTRIPDYFHLNYSENTGSKKPSNTVSHLIKEPKCTIAGLKPPDTTIDKLQTSPYQTYEITLTKDYEQNLDYVWKAFDLKNPKFDSANSSPYTTKKTVVTAKADDLNNINKNGTIRVEEKRDPNCYAESTVKPKYEDQYKLIGKKSGSPPDKSKLPAEQEHLITYFIDFENIGLYPLDDFQVLDSLKKEIELNHIYGDPNKINPGDMRVWNKGEDPDKVDPFITIAGYFDNVQTSSTYRHVVYEQNPPFILYPGQFGQAFFTVTTKTVPAGTIIYNSARLESVQKKMPTNIVEHHFYKTSDLLKFEKTSDPVQNPDPNPFYDPKVKTHITYTLKYTNKSGADLTLKNLVIYDTLEEFDPKNAEQKIIPPPAAINPSFGYYDDKTFTIYWKYGSDVVLKKDESRVLSFVVAVNQTLIGPFEVNNQAFLTSQPYNLPSEILTHRYKQPDLPKSCTLVLDPDSAVGSANPIPFKAIIIFQNASYDKNNLNWSTTVDGSTIKDYSEDKKEVKLYDTLNKTGEIKAVYQGDGFKCEDSAPITTPPITPSCTLALNPDSAVGSASPLPFEAIITFQNASYDKTNLTWTTTVGEIKDYTNENKKVNLYDTLNKTGEIKAVYQGDGFKCEDSAPITTPPITPSCSTFDIQPNEANASSSPIPFALNITLVNATYNKDNLTWTTTVGTIKDYSNENKQVSLYDTANKSGQLKAVYKDQDKGFTCEDTSKIKYDIVVTPDCSLSLSPGSAKPGNNSFTADVSTTIETFQKERLSWSSAGSGTIANTDTTTVDDYHGKSTTDFLNSQKGATITATYTLSTGKICSGTSKIDDGGPPGDRCPIDYLTPNPVYTNSSSILLQTKFTARFADNPGYPNPNTDPSASINLKYIWTTNLENNLFKDADGTVPDCGPTCTQYPPATNLDLGLGLNPIYLSGGPVPDNKDRYVAVEDQKYYNTTYFCGATAIIKPQPVITDVCTTPIINAKKEADTIYKFTLSAAKTLDPSYTWELRNKNDQLISNSDFAYKKNIFKWDEVGNPSSPPIASGEKVRLMFPIQKQEDYPLNVYVTHDTCRTVYQIIPPDIKCSGNFETKIETISENPPLKKIYFYHPYIGDFQWSVPTVDDGLLIDTNDPNPNNPSDKDAGLPSTSVIVYNSLNKGKAQKSDSSTWQYVYFQARDLTLKSVSVHVESTETPSISCIYDITLGEKLPPTDNLTKEVTPTFYPGETANGKPVTYTITYYPNYDRDYVIITDTVGENNGVVPGKNKSGNKIVAKQETLNIKLSSGTGLPSCSDRPSEICIDYNKFFTPAGIKINNLKKDSNIIITYGGTIQVPDLNCEYECGETFPNIAESFTPGSTRSADARVDVICKYLLTRNDGDVLFEKGFETGADVSCVDAEVRNTTGLAILKKIDEGIPQMPKTGPDWADVSLSICDSDFTSNLIIKRFSSFICEIETVIELVWEKTEIQRALEQNKSRVLRPHKYALMPAQHLIDDFTGDLLAISSNYKQPNPNQEIYKIADQNLIFNLLGEITPYQGAKTFIIENHDLIILKNISIQKIISKDQFPDDKRKLTSLAFIVINGRILVDSKVTQMAGVYFVQKGNNPLSGKLDAYHNYSSSDQLTINGSVFGDLEPLFKKRTYVGEARRDGGAIVIRYNEMILLNTPPGLEEFMDLSWLKTAR